MDTSSSSQPAEAPAAQDQPSPRKTCRRCGQHFPTRNKLMRHLFDSHSPPGSPATRSSRAPATRKETGTKGTPKPGSRSDTPKREQPQIHPFSMLSAKQQLAFTFYALYILFVVGQKQLESEQEQIRRLPALDSDQMQRPRQSSQALSSPLNTVSADQTNQGPIEEDSELEDSDDGGVALSGPMLEGLAVRVRGLEDDLNDITQLEDVD